MSKETVIEILRKYDAQLAAGNRPAVVLHNVQTGALFTTPIFDGWNAAESAISHARDVGVIVTDPVPPEVISRARNQFAQNVLVVPFREEA